MLSRVLRKVKKNEIMIGRKDSYFTERHGNVFLLVIMPLKMWFLFTGRETIKSEIISKVLKKD